MKKKKDDDLLRRYETPQTSVRVILFENCILSGDDRLDGSAGEDAGDEPYPGF